MGFDTELWQSRACFPNRAGLAASLLSLSTEMKPDLQGRLIFPFPNFPLVKRKVHEWAGSLKSCRCFWNTLVPRESTDSLLATDYVARLQTRGQTAQYSAVLAQHSDVTAAAGMWPGSVCCRKQGTARGCWTCGSSVAPSRLVQMPDQGSGACGFFPTGELV